MGIGDAVKIFYTIAHDESDVILWYQLWMPVIFAIGMIYGAGMGFLFGRRSK